MKKWFGRIGYDREGIVNEKEFETEAEATAYKLGAEDAIHESVSGELPLEDYWATASDQESIAES